LSEPGFDFIRLTKPQWRYLKEVEKKHGIPWHIYIRDLIKLDMEGGNKGGSTVLSIDLENIIGRLESFLERPKDFVPSWQPEKPKPGSADFSGILDEDLVKPSALKKTVVLPPPHSPTGEVIGQRVSLMVELRQVLGLPELDTKRKLMMSRPIVTGMLSPPPPPPPPPSEE